MSRQEISFGGAGRSWVSSRAVRVKAKERLFLGGEMTSSPAGRPEWRPVTRMPPQWLWPAACPFSWPRPWLSMPLGAPGTNSVTPVALRRVVVQDILASHIGRAPSITGAGSVTGQTKAMHATVLLPLLAVLFICM